MVKFSNECTYDICILDPTSSCKQAVIDALSSYKIRWKESIANKVYIASSKLEIKEHSKVVCSKYMDMKYDIGLSILDEDLNRNVLRALSINIEYEYTDDFDQLVLWLDASSDTIACDFESSSKWSSDEVKSFKEAMTHMNKDSKEYHEIRLKTLANGLSHPSLTQITHFSFADTEDKGYVLICRDDSTRTKLFNWLTTTKKKQVWHNILFDWSHVYYHTNKMPIDYEDSMLAWKTILNHTETNKRKASLKHLAKDVYRDWAVSADLFTVENLDNSDLIKYSAIDPMATMYLWNEALFHEDFQLDTTIDLLDNILPIKQPRDYNPGRRYFYESVVKNLIPSTIVFMANGIALDKDKVKVLADRFDSVINTAIEALNSHASVREFLLKESAILQEKTTLELRSKIKGYEEFYQKFKPADMTHRSYFVEVLLSDTEIEYRPTAVLPNGRCTKWSANDIKKLLNTDISDDISSTLKALLSKSVEHPEIELSMVMLAKDKALLNKNNVSYENRLKNIDSLEVRFNPKSTPQVQRLFSYLKVPVLSTSKDTGEASYSSDVLKEYSETFTGPVKEICDLMLDISDVYTTRTNFVKNFELYTINDRIYGNYNIFGTLSFRPSGGGSGGKSNGKINLLNQPASRSPQAKYIKQCMIAPEGKILIANDYTALEEMVACCIIQDPNKIKILSQGYDSHCYHTLYYWKNEVEKHLGKSDSSLEFNKLFKTKTKEIKELDTLRSNSKQVSFGIGYGAYPKKIAESLGSSLAEGQRIFNAYHNDLYPTTTKYREEYVVKTVKDTGELHLGFGCSLKSDNIRKDVRSVNNATCQFFSILTLISMAKLQKEIDAKGLGDRVKVINTVYDALYLEVDDDLELIDWVNVTLVDIMQEQYLEYEPVSNRAACDIGYDLSVMEEIPNNATVEEIQQVRNTLKG